jgi:hypothetical protein
MKLLVSNLPRFVAQFSTINRRDSALTTVSEAFFFAPKVTVTR